MAPLYQILFELENNTDDTKNVVLFDNEYLLKDGSIIPKTVLLTDPNSQETVPYEDFINEILKEDTYYGIAKTQLMVVSGRNDNVNLGINAFYPVQDGALFIPTMPTPRQFRSDATETYLRYALYKGVKIVITLLANTKLLVYFGLSCKLTGTKQEALREPHLLNADESEYRDPREPGVMSFVLEKHVEKKLDEILSIVRQLKIPSE